MFSTIVDWLLANPVVLGIIGGWIAGRVMLLPPGAQKIIRTLCQAIDDPSRGKAIVRESKEAGSVTLNSALDVVSPGRHVSPTMLSVDKPRVSRGRQVGSFLRKLVPFLSLL